MLLWSRRYLQGITEMCSVSYRESKILAVRSGQDEISVSRVFAEGILVSLLCMGLLMTRFHEMHVLKYFVVR